MPQKAKKTKLKGNRRRTTLVAAKRKKTKLSGNTRTKSLSTTTTSTPR